MRPHHCFQHDLSPLVGRRLPQNLDALLVLTTVRFSLTEHHDQSKHAQTTCLPVSGKPIWASFYLQFPQSASLIISVFSAAPPKPKMLIKFTLNGDPAEVHLKSSDRLLVDVL